MKTFVILLILLVLGVAAFFGYRAYSQGIVVDISQEQIQQQLDKKFPIQKTYLVSSVTLSNPKVELKNGSDRIFVGVNVAAGIPAVKNVSGAAEISGKVDYDPNAGEFFLKDAQLEKVSMTGLPDKHIDQVKTIVDALAKEVLNRFSIYKLQESDRLQAITKLFLQSVGVEGGKLRIKMGLKKT